MKKEDKGLFPSSNAEGRNAQKVEESKKGNKKIIDILGKGLKDEKQSVEYFKAAGVKPLKEKNGKAVKVMYATKDGNFFYDSASASVHVNKRGISKDIFEIKIN